MKPGTSRLSIWYWDRPPVARVKSAFCFGRATKSTKVCAAAWFRALECALTLSP